MTRLQTPRGKLFILVGPAGAGKNSLMRAAIDAVPGLRQLPTATSRPIRPGELEGREHYFVSRDQFEAMIAHDDLLEWQKNHGVNYYGMIASKTREALEAGERVIADIDYLGALSAQDAYPNDVVTIFITPPTAAELVARMRARGEPSAEIARRMLRAPREFAFARRCDYVIENEDIEAGARLLAAIVVSESDGRRADIPRSRAPVLINVARFEVCDLQGTLLAEGEVECPPDSDELPQRIAAQQARLSAGIAIQLSVDSDDFVEPDDLSVESRADGLEAAVYTYRFLVESSAAPQTDHLHV